MVRMALDMSGASHKIAYFSIAYTPALKAMRRRRLPNSTSRRHCAGCSQSCRSATKNALAFPCRGPGSLSPDGLRHPWVTDAVLRLPDPIGHDGPGANLGI